MANVVASLDDAAFLTDGGEVGALMREHDWSASPLGTPSTWPQSLRSVVGLLLASKFPMFVAWGPGLGFLYNDAYAEILGAKHPAALGARFHDIWSEIWPDISPLIDAALAGQSTYHEDLPLVVNRKGFDEQAWFTFSYSPVRDESGRVAGMYCAVAETTARVLAERHSASERERLARMFEQAPGFITILKGPEHVFDFANATYRRLFGNRDFVGRPAREVFPDLAGQGFFKLLDQVYSTGERFVARNVPVRLAHSPDGPPEELVLDFIYEPVTDEAGQVTGIFCEGHDVTKARRTEERLQLATEAAELGIFDVDFTTGRMDWDLRQRELWSLGPDEVITDEIFWGGVHPEDRDRVQEVLAQAFDPEGDGLYSAEFRLLPREDSSECWIAATGRVHFDGKRPVRLIGTTQDITARKRTEAALRASEARLRLAVGAGQIGEWELDVATDTSVRAFRHDQIFGYDEPVENWGFETFIGHVIAEDGSRVEAAFRHAAETGTGWHFECRIRRANDGALRWIVAHSEPQLGPNGKIQRLYGLVQDVTEERQAQEQLRASEARLRELNETLEQRVAEALAQRKLLADVFENTDAMMAVADLDLRLLAFNQAYADEVERLGGRRPQIGRRIPDLYAGRPDLAAPAEANWSRAVLGEVFSRSEERGDPGRYRRWYERRFEPLYDREGRQIGAYQYATDVTERLRDQRRAEEAEAARREADALYRAYFQNSAEGLFVIGVLPDGRFSLDEINPADRAILANIGLDLVAGKPIEEQLPPEMATAITANYRRLVETGEVQRYRESAPAAGLMMHFETVLVPVRDQKGRITRIMGSTRDMTAQVQAEEALRQSQKMEAMGQLTGGVAHDFNNLLTPIIASLDMLLRRGVGSERERRLMDGALQSAERAKTLVQRLLAFARRQPLQPGPVDVKSLVGNMTEFIASTLGPRIDVQVELPDELPPALADANQLEMAVLNLAVNARDAMPDSGVLTISAARESVRGPHPAKLRHGHYVRLSVRDTGVGMDEVTLARAVEPFFSTKGIGKGTGLGLSMVHGLVSQLNGGLTIASSPGNGTTVDLWLPISAVAAEEDGSRSRAMATPGSEGTALLVDDEDLVRMSTADMLMDLGYEVVEAQSAEEALRLMGEGLRPDLVVTDHLMPGLSGLDLARDLRTRRPDLPVLIVSGYAEMDGIAPGFQRLTKPFRSAELAASLAALVPTKAV